MVFGRNSNILCVLSVCYEPEMSKRIHYGSSGDTPGKTTPKNVRFLTNRIRRVHEEPGRNLFSDSSSDTSGRRHSSSVVKGRNDSIGGVCDVVLGRSLPPPPHTSGWPSHKDEKFWEACVLPKFR